MHHLAFLFGLAGYALCAILIFGTTHEIMPNEEFSAGGHVLRLVIAGLLVAFAYLAQRGFSTILDRASHRALTAMAPASAALVLAQTLVSAIAYYCFRDSWDLLSGPAPKPDAALVSAVVGLILLLPWAFEYFEARRSASRQA